MQRETIKILGVNIDNVTLEEAGSQTKKLIEESNKTCKVVVAPNTEFIMLAQKDEEFFNILKGDMSVVGPRPERPELIKEAVKNTPEFILRTKVKAGLTGYAQVYGRYNTTPYDKLKLDLYYIQNYSIFLDLKLILLTVKILFQKENTEGVEKWQTTASKSENEARQTK